MATTIRDVAQSAGVSMGTVSRILRDDQRHGFTASPETRQRVLAAAQELGYRPNTAARAMVGGRTGLIGVVIGSVSESFLERILAGVQSFAEASGLAIVLYTDHRAKSSDNREHRNLLDAVQSRQLDGVIAAHCYLSPKVLNELQQQETPVVLLSPQSTPGYSAVHVNDEAGGRLAGEHLLALGHRRIGFVGYRSVYSAARQRGLARVLAEAGATLLKEVSPSDGPSVRSEPWRTGEALADKLLRQHSACTAIVCSDDYNAVGVLAAAQKIGRRVPDDLSLIGYDDLLWTAFTQPPLTTVQQPKEVQGTRAAELLQELWQGGKPREVWLEPQLTVRASTAAISTAAARGTTTRGILMSQGKGET